VWHRTLQQIIVSQTETTNSCDISSEREKAKNNKVKREWSKERKNKKEKRVLTSL